MSNNSTQAQSDNKKIISDVMTWLETQLVKHEFADMTISLSVHGGKISKTQKSLTQKFQ